MDALAYGGPDFCHLGSDPEVFMVKDGAMIPAFLHVESYERQKLSRSAEPGIPYNDGFALEFQTRPDTCMNFAVDGIHDGLWHSAAQARSLGARLSLCDALDVPDMSEFSPEQIRLGCSRSMNAYGECVAVPEDPYELLYRTIGFHIHLGFQEEAEHPRPIRAVKCIDAIAGPIMTSLLAGLEDPRRRVVYGRAGEFRVKPYGFEYRVPSAAVMHHPVLVHMLLSLTRLATQISMNQDAFTHLSDRLAFDNIRDIINFCDVERARDWLKENADEYRRVLSAVGDSDTYKEYEDEDDYEEEHPYSELGLRVSAPEPEELFEFILEGAARHLPACSSPDAFEEAWRIRAADPPAKSVYEAQEGMEDGQFSLDSIPFWVQHSELPGSRISFSREAITTYVS